MVVFFCLIIHPNEDCVKSRRLDVGVDTAGIDSNLNQGTTMSIVVENEQETVRQGLDVLNKHLPPSKVARLLSIWRVGEGDYTRERRKFFAHETVGSLFKKARALEKHGRKG
jgi:hypothetical protein